jgi:hypothetical protein
MWKLRTFFLVSAFGACGLLVHANGTDAGHNGVWAGATSRDENLGFVVAGNAVTQLEVEWRIRLDEPCRTDPNSPIPTTVLGGRDTLFFHAGSPGHEPLEIVSDAWHLEQSPMTGRKDISMAISGKFAGDEATGELVLKVIAGCKGQLTTTWKAALVKPATGGVAAAPASAPATPFGAPRMRITSHLFNTILSTKMAQAGVEALFGPGKPSGRSGVPADMTELVWEDEGGSMTVQFKDGRAQGGTTSLREPK